MDRKADNLSGKAMARVATMAAETAQVRRAASGAIADLTAGWLGSRYLLTLDAQLAERADDGADRFKLLRQAAGDVVAFQRGNGWSARVELEREALEFQRQKHKDKMAAIAQLAEAKAVKRRDPHQPMTDEELKACVDKVDEIMGLKPTSNRF